jgi:hypothetical protein
MDGEDQESTAPGAFRYYGNEARVNGAVVVVVDAVCDGDSVVTVVFGGGLTVDVSELRTTVRRAP